MVAGWRAAAAALAVAAVVGVRGAQASEEAPERVIRYGKDALTVRLVQVPLSEVLDEVGRQTGAEIRGQLREPREVSAEFETVPLSEALHRLLGNQNFALVYGSNGELRAVKLLGGPQAGAVPVAAPSPAAGVPVRPTAVSPGALQGLMSQAPPVPIHGRLAETLGSESATLPQLMELGLHHEDPTVRAEALRTGVQTLEGDEGLRSSVLSVLNNMDDGTLSQLLRSAAGERAEEVAMQILTQSRATELRVKASSVLQKLRSGG
jgi:hypothetical protein